MFEGLWWKADKFHKAGDGFLRSNVHNPQQQYHHAKSLIMGEISVVHPEPTWKQHLVTVRPIMGGEISLVPIPGPNIIAGKSGIPSSDGGLHGLWESPLPGQQVLMGFVGGNGDDPVVIQKYPYNPSENPLFKSAYILPMTKKTHGPLDIILGSFTGAYIALRGTLPLPGEIDIDAPTQIKVNAVAGIGITTNGSYTASAATGFDFSSNVAFKAVANESITLEGGQTVEIKSSSGTVTIKMGEEGLILHTNDSNLWVPNCIAQCPFSGAPHGGPTAGISLLKGA